MNAVGDHLWDFVEMRFYFDSKNDLFEVYDKDGIDLPDIARARAHALRALGAILSDLAGKESSGRVLISVRGPSGPKALIKALAFFDISEPT